MDYTSIHIYGHFLSDDILHSVEQDRNLIGNREQDFALDTSVQTEIDYAWSSLRNDWRFFKERNAINDIYGTRRSRDLIERMLANFGFELKRQNSNTIINGVSYEITYTCPSIKELPIIVVGDKTGDSVIDTLDKCSLDYRAKGSQKKKSPHATMLEYLNNTENVYGIISNGKVLRIIRNTGQLVKLTYIEFDLHRMLEEDKYTEFCLMFRLLHATRFRVSGDEQCIMERYFNMSIESGNRIRDGLSKAVQRTMEIIGCAAIQGNGIGNNSLRDAILTGRLSPAQYNKELIHFIYRVLFLFIIEERNLVYQIPSVDSKDYKRLCKLQEIYKKYYAVSLLRQKSELAYLRQRHYNDLWQGLMDTFRLFENENYGEPLGIKPLGGMLFNENTLRYLKECDISNAILLEAFSSLNEFFDDKQQRVKINYSSLDVEEFGSVYEGILEMRPFINQSSSMTNWSFGYVGGLDRKSTSSYYTRPDLVQSLIKTTLIPVIEKILSECKTKEEKVKALLNLKVCDAASGSGHIVLAMARTIAWYVCTIRTGEDNPASLDYRLALREVIQKCIYAVDYNPDAVELCKVVLWIEGYCAGTPLSFLDHHIRCGNSVVGITDLNVLLKGVPREAFCAAETGDAKAEKEIVKTIRSHNQDAIDEIHGTRTLFNKFEINEIDEEQIGLANNVRAISELPENSLIEELTKKKKWEDLMVSPRVECLRRACDIYTYSFYKQFTAEDVKEELVGTNYILPDVPYTRTVYQALEEIKYIDEPKNDFTPLSDKFKTEVSEISKRHSFFHWCVEFPEVFSGNGGFDVMCGNPPWDKLQMEDEKWFVGKNEKIVNAGNKNERDILIKSLAKSDIELFDNYNEARRDIACQSSFIKNANRYAYCNHGKIELSSLFAELCMTFSIRAWGIVCPTSIAFGDSTKYFFEKLVSDNRLKSIYDFENREKLFDIDSRYKFCLLTAGCAQKEPREVKGGFYLTRLDHLLDPARIYSLMTDDFTMLNPNTKTCPIFRSRYDAQLTKKIYKRIPILLNENTGEHHWGIRPATLFNMATHSYLFKTREQLMSLGAKEAGNNFILNDEEYVPLYEGKLFWHYNHHYGEFPLDGDRPSSIPSTSISVLKDINSKIRVWYWVKYSDVKNRLTKVDSDGNVLWEWKHQYFIGFRDVTNATNERTCVASLMPSNVGAGDKAPLVFTSQSLIPNMCLLAMMSSLPFDYVARQKVGGSSMAFFMMKQLPFLTPEQIPFELKMPIVSRVAKLCYFNHDLDGWAEELWNELSTEQRAELPELGRKECYVYDPDKRAVLQSELDAIFAHLYGLTTEDVKYILDPEDVCGPGCINETFRVLKDNEIREFGEYRTKRLVLEAWYKFGYDN